MSVQRGIWPIRLCLFTGLLGLVGFGCYYWQSLPDRSRPAKVLIPNSELLPASQLAVQWQVPREIRERRWHRTPVRVLESGEPLSFRAEHSDFVASQGNGRYCITDAQLWFSAKDNSKPGTNGKSYELEIGHAEHRSGVLAYAFLALTIAALMLAAPWKRWWASIRNFCRAAEIQTPLARPVPAAICLAMSALALTQAFSPTALWRRFDIPPGAIFQQPDGACRYYVARWVRNDLFRLLDARLFEDHKPLVRASLPDFNETAKAGMFSSERDAVLFRPSEPAYSSTAVRRYELAIRLVSPARSICWTLVFAALGCWFLWPRHLHQVSLPPAAWRAAIIAIILAKLWVIAGDDVIAQVSDSEDYAVTTLQPLWGSTGFLPGHPPGFPMLAGLAEQFGLPWRISLELMYLAVCLLLAKAIGSFLRWPGALFVAFCVLAWHPWTLSGFRFFMSDPVVLVLLGAMLALMFQPLGSSVSEWRWSSALLLGLTLFVWNLARKEEPLLYGFYLVFIVAALAIAKLRNEWRPPLRKRALVWLLVPLTLAGALGLAQKWSNFRQCGVYAKCLMDAPGLKSLQSALYHIRPEKTIRFAPVTYHSLQLACEVSPTLNNFAPRLLDSNTWPAVIKESGTGMPGEFGPTLIWLLTTSITGEPRARDRSMLQAANEINAALTDGRLPRRAAWFPLEPNWRLWLPELPRCCWQALEEEMLLAPAGEPEIKSYKAVVARTFDQAANRRAENIAPRLLLTEGSIHGPAGLIDSVALSDGNGKWLGACPVLASNWWDDAQTFSIIFQPASSLTNAQLVFVSRGKTQHVGKLDLQNVRRVSEGADELLASAEKHETGLPVLGSNETFDYTLRAKLIEPQRYARRAFAENFLEAEYRKILISGLLIVLMCAFFQGEWQPERFRAVAFCCILAAGCLLARAAFYGLVDANMGFRADRYTRCASPLFVAFLFLGAVLAGAWLRRRIAAHDARIDSPGQP